MSSTTDQTGNVPNTDAEWFALIEPAIDIEPADATTEDLERIAKQHAGQVVDRVGAFNVDLDAIEWRASKQLKNYHGVFHSGNYRISLSLPSLRRNGWRAMLRTVRHELVHAWQHEHDKHDTDWGEDIHDIESFERWMSVLNIRKRGPAKTAEFRYRIQCTQCGRSWGKHRMCKSIRQSILGQRYCAACGPDSSGSLVVTDHDRGTLLTEDDISSSQNYRVFYSAFPETRASHTVELTSFPGIGPRTAEKIAPEYGHVEQMVDGLTLDDRLREIVADRFHDELWAEIRTYVDWEAEPGERSISGVTRPNPESYFEERERIDPEITQADVDVKWLDINLFSGEDRVIE